MPSTEIILTENIPGLGAEADVVKVRRGYARNYLLPQGKAFEVTKQSLRQLDSLKAKREREASNTSLSASTLHPSRVRENEMSKLPLVPRGMNFSHAQHSRLRRRTF